jgi:hypothetical protein
MPIQVRGVLVHARSGTELSRVRTEFRLRLPEPINKSPLASSGADIVMQSRPDQRFQLSGKPCQFKRSMQHHLVSWSYNNFLRETDLFVSTR